MKSPIYLLTALLPLTLALPSAEEADVDSDDIDVHLAARKSCKSSKQINYYQWPVVQTGSYQAQTNVDYRCKWRNGDWYKTGKNWWVRGSDVPSSCKSGLPTCGV
ncbi:hypothetical protein BO86DRAFT_436036 [Aspergillus japonicus CBS 114.51]|uniref:Uncharacterized protein n=2 Tax=Aspergillus TaxID=5052 RepID=A0A2V5H7F1_ASPV1|nr:hypothetical protein BO86DRAFT_436036 [Aspergillus japonicus CBS 114.51]PYI18042.1 hypothetical protein BO99DRAFT_433861 [Aspergillus violaceofuscus CBS 115571]RAH79478.1 hypothetical protein BO86DRAFT_436036 [Aspergillus japonicus CBS 114.51]